MTHLHDLCVYCPRWCHAHFCRHLFFSVFCASVVFFLLFVCLFCLFVCLFFAFCCFDCFWLLLFIYRWILPPLVGFVVVLVGMSPPPHPRCCFSIYCCNYNRCCWILLVIIERITAAVISTVWHLADWGESAHTHCTTRPSVEKYRTEMIKLSARCCIPRTPVLLCCCGCCLPMLFVVFGRSYFCGYVH